MDYRDSPTVIEPDLTDDEQTYHDKCLKYLSQKGVYCYTFFSDFKKMELTHLPDIKCFKNDLANKECLLVDYIRALRVFEHFGLKNLREYTQLYLASDVMILCDIFEKFRRTSLSIYGLDPGRFMTAGSLAITAAMKESGKTLQLLTDQGMYMQFERGLRGDDIFLKILLFMF